MNKAMVNLFQRKVEMLNSEVDKMRTSIRKAFMRRQVRHFEEKCRRLEKMTVEDRRDLLRECHDLMDRIREEHQWIEEWCANNWEW